MEFISEVWEYERRSPESEVEYDHESDVELLDGEAPIIREE